MRRRHSRRFHRNPGVLYTMAPVAKNRRSRRVRRNPDWMGEVVTPVLGGTVGFVAARALGNLLANQSLPLVAGNPNAGKLVAAAAAIPAAYFLARKSEVVRKNLGAIILGMGMAPVEGYIRGLPLLGGTTTITMPSTPIATAAPASTQSPNAVPAATSGLSDYYTAGMLGGGVGEYFSQPVAGLGTGMDISHAGAPYKGMLGLGDGADLSDQSVTDGILNTAEGIPAISTVTPTDVASPMPMVPYAAPMTERMGTPGGRGYAGGIFSRTLFSGL